MKTRGSTNYIFSLGVAMAGVFALTGLSAFAAITIPTADLTFNNNASSDNYYTTPGNWSTSTAPTNSDNALIGDGLTVYHSQSANGDPQFGTLTLGTGSTFQFKANNNQGFGGTGGTDIYFKNNSHLEYTGGTSNRDDHYYIPSGADAKVTIATSTMQRGSLSGAGSLEYDMTKGNLELRRSSKASGYDPFTGNQTFTNTGGSARKLWLRTYGETEKLGGGINTVGNNIYVQQDKTGKINDAATLKLVGAGYSGYKYSLTGGDEALANLIIDSPNQSGPYLVTGNNTNATSMIVTDTATFQGTAGTVEIQSKMSGYYSGKPRTSKANINAGNLVFAGTGDWTINGSLVTTGDPADFAPGAIGVANGGDVTTDTNVTINSPFAAPSGFTKKGNGSLTLNYYDTHGTPYGQTNLNPTGPVNVQAGTLVVNNNLSGATTTVSSGATLKGSGTLGPVTVNSGGILAPGNSPGTMTVSDLTLVDGANYNWEFTSPTDYDQVNVTGDITLGDVTLNLLPFQNKHVEETDTFTLFTYNTSGTNNIDVTNWTVTYGAPSSWWTAQNASIVDDGNGLITLSGIAIIPEPSTIILGALGLMGVTFRRRRRK